MDCRWSYDKKIRPSRCVTFGKFGMLEQQIAFGMQIVTRQFTRGSSMRITIEPVGYVHSQRTAATDDNWSVVQSWIELDKNYTEESLMGLNAFSHVEILFYFHKVDPSSVVRTSEHPRDNPNWPKVGVFSQRKRARPNLLGTTICELTKVEGKRIYVRHLDAIDQTPVIDIKPVFREFLPDEVSKVCQPTWVTELMMNYW